MAYNLKEADKLFEAGTFQDALKEYDAAYQKSSDDETRTKAFFRICESLTHLFRYGDAAQRVISTPITEKMPFRGRLLILKADILRNFLTQYSQIQGKEIVEGEGSDIYRLTPAEIKEEIGKTYEELFKLRRKLQTQSIKGEDYYLDIKDVDFGMYPTLFDFVILTWTDFLLEEASDGKNPPDSGQLLVSDFKKEVNFKDTPALLAAELMEEAGRGRAGEASERWKIKRLLLPLNYAVFELKDQKAYREKAKEILLEWMDQFKTKVAKAEAGLKAAAMMEQNEEYVEAVKLCGEIERKFGGTTQKDLARILRLNIEQPSLSLVAKTTLPPGKGAFEATTRNLKEVYCRVYLLNPDEVKDSSEQFYGWSRALSSPYEKWLEKYLSRAKPYKEWTVKIKDMGDHKYCENKIDPPALKSGFYMVLMSSDRSFIAKKFRANISLLKAAFFNVTDLVLLGTAGGTKRTRDAYYGFIDKAEPDKIEDECFRFYALDAKTGKPAGGAEISVYLGYPFNDMKDIKADRNGLATLAQSFDFTPGVDNSYSVDPLAKHNNSFAFFRYGLNYYYSEDNPINLFITSDRPIYRPGQKFMAKIVAVKRTAGEFRTFRKGQTVSLVAFDANHEKFFSKTVSLSEFGSADIEFMIPEGRLLGQYSLLAEAGEGVFTNTNQLYFSVEEYKRPEFEITLKPADQPLKYDRPAVISGSAKYYFGGAVPDAPVAYRIKRQHYIPWFYRFWFQENIFGGEEEVATGQTKTDSEGNFSIQFTPAPSVRQPFLQKIPEMTNFIVEVEGRDSGGRTISAQQSYRAGRKAIYFRIEPKKGFYSDNESMEIDSKLLTINDTPVSGESVYKIFGLARTEGKSLESDYMGGWKFIPPLEVQLADVANDKLAAEGSLNHDKSGLAEIKVPPLPPGTYRIVQKTKDQWGEEVEQDKILVVAKKDGAVPIKAASVTLVEKDEYQVGETARFIIGSVAAKGVYQVEIWSGKYLLKNELIDDNKPVRLFEVPVTRDMKGGFSLRWFGVSDLNVYQGSATVSVPWTEKKLTVSLAPFKKELRPGEKQEWGIKLADAFGHPAQGEALALMYDRSLEYYSGSNSFWLDNLYKLKEAPIFWNDSVFRPEVQDFSSYIYLSPPSEPRLPGLRTAKTWVGPQMPMGAVMMEREALPPPSATPKAVAGAGLGSETEAKKIEARAEFAETAFFKPFLKTGSDGRAMFSFIAPEQLTGWKVKVFALTKDIKEGSLIQDAVTKKDLMVRADLPRFFREKDEGTITAVVHNETNRELQGELYFGDNKRKFSVKPQGLQSFDWKISIPEGIGTYKVRVVAVSGSLSDAEEREIPILPSRERLIESTFAALSGSETKKLEISLKNDPTRINESMILEIDPQLALSILNSIPFLVEYPYECVEQLLNKYIPLSIVNEIYDKYPALRKAVDKVPKHKTITPAWEKEDPRRLTALMETPWVWQSEGRPTSYPVVDLLDPGTVSLQKEINLLKIRSAQLSNGAFPWWPGGSEDLYMTLYVLSGFAEARRYGVDVPEDVINKALGYVNSEIPKILKPEERNLALISYAAYVLTSYSPDEFPEAKKGYEAARSWVKLMEDHLQALTPFGKAYLSYTYLRLGNKKRANEVLDMAMDGAREDPIAGVYWTPEKYSWVWYSDTVEKHAFFLRTLQELRPQDKRIPGMVKWLLFNRKGTVWKSTKASVAAVYALLDFMKQSGALTADENFSVKWGNNNYSAVVKADDWLEKPLRWQKTGFEITEKDQTAVITKEGRGLAFASLTWTYSSDKLSEASEPGLLELDRKFYLRVKEGDAYHLKPLQSGDKVRVGDEIEVQLKINTRSQFEYMHLKDLKAAGFEGETLLSGWKYSPLWYYEEPRDSLTNFFLSWLPQGEYVLSYKLRPTKPGTYRIGSATLQSMYSPEMTAHSAGFIISVISNP